MDGQRLAPQTNDSERSTSGIDFETGKIRHVTQALRPNRNREYQLLAVVLLACWSPYLVALWWWPLHTLIVLLFLAYFQVIIAFATSTSTDTAHAIRFLLSGSNPIGMTGSSSLLFGAVDAIIDWTEDTGERTRRPIKFWALCFYKALMTPVGCVLMATEYLWDVVLMRRPSLVPRKWSELFSLAEYHDIVCPEKSNDIFYSDLAYARWQDDAMLYQWNRLRSMVFELEHYRIDAANMVGVPETNLFLQSEIAAYQTLKRLELERLEYAIEVHHTDNPDWFPFPERIADRLVRNAKPITHYLRMRESLLQSDNKHSFDKPLSFDKALSELLREDVDGKYRCWYVLRILDSLAERQTSDLGETLSEVSSYLTNEVLSDLVCVGVLEQSDSGICIHHEFTKRFDELLRQHYEVVAAEGCPRLEKVPDYLQLNGRHYVRRN